MPNRIIRDSCRTSPNLDSLSDGAERMFWRLTTVADDFGRFQADPRILLAHCFPLKVNCVKTKQIEKWLNELITCELVKTYVCNGVTYGYFVTWEKHQHIRNQKSKFPDPTIDNTCKQLPANVPVIQSNPIVIQTESNPIKDHPAKNAGTLFKNPKQVDLKDIRIEDDKVPLSEASKHRLFNTVIDLFNARGWDSEGDMPIQVFRAVALEINQYRPKQVFPYFAKALKNYLNEKSELLSTQTKINRGNENDKKRLLNSPVGMALEKTMKSLQPKEA